MLDRTDLCQLLRNGGKAIVGKLNEARKPVDPSGLICVSINAKVKKYGRNSPHRVPPNPTAPSVSKTKPSLLKALARAHGWYQSVLEGKASDLRTLAHHVGFTARYVGKVFPCAFLAPYIIESILQRHQPDDLTFARLSREIPLSWTEQRRLFGFPPAESRWTLKDLSQFFDPFRLVHRPSCQQVIQSSQSTRKKTVSLLLKLRPPCIKRVQIFLGRFHFSVSGNEPGSITGNRGVLQSSTFVFQPLLGFRNTLLHTGILACFEVRELLLC